MEGLLDRLTRITGWLIGGVMGGIAFAFLPLGLEDKAPPYLGPAPYWPYLLNARGGMWWFGLGVAAVCLLLLLADILFARRRGAEAEVHSKEPVGSKRAADSDATEVEAQSSREAYEEWRRGLRTQRPVQVHHVHTFHKATLVDEFKAKCGDGASNPLADVAMSLGAVLTSPPPAQSRSGHAAQVQPGPHVGQLMLENSGRTPMRVRAQMLSLRSVDTGVDYVELFKLVNPSLFWIGPSGQPMDEVEIGPKERWPLEVARGLGHSVEIRSTSDTIAVMQGTYRMAVALAGKRLDLEIKVGPGLVTGLRMVSDD